MSAKNHSVKVFLVGTMIDGNGGEPLRDAAVVIEDGRFTQIGPRASITYDPQNSGVIEAPQSTVIPGLIDCHNHIFLKGDRTYLQSHLVFQVAKAIKNAAELLKAGTTTIRDLGAHIGNPGLYFREALKAGLIMGPRMFSSGDAMRMTGGMVGPLAFGLEIDSPDEARKTARQQLKAGADLLKVIASEPVGYSRMGLYKIAPHLSDPPARVGGILGRPQLTLEEIKPIVEEAHKVDVTVSCHAMSAESIKVALSAGVDTIEHAIVMDQESVDIAAEQGTALVPTMSIIHTMAYRGKEYDYPVAHSENAKRFYDILVSSMELARQADIRIATGTDCINDDTIAMECSRFLDAGFSPMEAIVAATRVGAEILKQDEELGTIEVGKRADLVILEGNPLEDIKALESVSYVIKDGEIVVGG
jgi:imidazolonepropionase-like amidohydrolase